jgi:hypothetical protein
MLYAAIMLLISSCEKPVLDELITTDATTTTSDGSKEKTKRFTFTVKGDFSDNWKPVTRGYLAADGKDMTDLWVLDYDADGNLLQQLHQGDNTAEDFGKSVMNLTYGSHHIYFIASRGSEPTLDTDTKTISFAKISDTFWKDYQVDVVPTSNGNRAVTLDRIVTKLRLTFTDAIPAGTASINVTPASWYYGFDYTTGLPTAAVVNKTFTIAVTDSYIGRTNITANMYGFSSSDEWTTDIAFDSRSTDNKILGSATITDAPFRRNRVTEYSGPLFGSDGTMTLSLNDEWEDPIVGTW